MAPSIPLRIGIDTGGTFTDFVVLQPDGRIDSFKLRSNPANPAEVILRGIAQAAQGRETEIVHGSTVATNALLERKGARTAFVTTQGFEDLFHIGRQNRAELYNLSPKPRIPLLPQEACFGLPERILYDGAILRELDPAAVETLRRELEAGGFESVAICFLHSYQNAAHERLAQSLLGDRFHLTASSSICPEHREYERASTTILNSYVGPLMDRYLGELEAGCPHPIAVMQSNGGFMSASEARRQAVRTLLSGPAGGVIGALETAKRSGLKRILGFDMGGTSTDVCLCDGEAQLTTESSLDGLPVRVPLLDIQTVGAGGGSLARVDAGGLLRVGPESAGAWPGPACYGESDRATVTDAHVFLGRITANQLAGGSLAIQPERSREAIEKLAASLGTTPDRTAEGILRLANASMERAIRNVSVERGHDPRDFALVAFGGCGALHGCEIAEELGIPQVMAPRHAGALSALGMLLADRTRDYAIAVLGRTDYEERFQELEREAGQHFEGAELRRSADVRYAGQSYELTVRWSGKDLEPAFHKAHQIRYGYHDAQRGVEVVTLRLRATEQTPRIRLHERRMKQRVIPALRRVFVSGHWSEIPVWNREQIAGRQTGPALVLDYGATTLVPKGWSVKVDNTGNLLLQQLKT